MTRTRRRRDDGTIPGILKEYDDTARTYGDMAAALRALISDLLLAEGISVHSVTCRTKTRTSLADKLQRDHSRYLRLTDITDICGVRVITFFPDAVDQVSAILEREFTIDRRNTVDKRAAMDPDRFGYLSVHHVVTIGLERARLAEYKRFAGYKAEIQTRSLLQHTWAEIEHDLGYKSGPDVPRVLRRQFARLAGLLELADQEFREIRDELRRYERDVVSRISQTPQQVGLDKASLSAFVETDATLRDIETSIAAIIGAKLVSEDASYLDGEAEKLVALGVTSIAELNSVLEQRRDVLLAFAEEWLRDDNHPAFERGIGLFYLWYTLIASSRTPQQIRQMLEDNNLGLPDERDENAESVMTVYKMALERCARSRIPGVQKQLPNPR